MIINSFTGPNIQLGSAEGTFDELRISARQRSDGEILGDYYAGLGINAMIAPTGLSIDRKNRIVIAESGANQVSVLSEDGKRLFRFGIAGSASGQFNTPWDMDTDASNNIYVVDSGNSRVQVFDETGIYLYQFGSSGSAAGQFIAPRGIHIDLTLGRIYVADTGNHRIQRFSLDGVLDTGWASGGIAGTTGVIKRDHTGFDGPTNMAVHPLTGQLYVTDFGNHRLEVFNNAGNHERTYLAVYRPNGLAFDSNGNLYIAGEDPNNNYSYMDGRLRLLKDGDELVSKHYTGGLDDLGRILYDVTLNQNDELIITDPLNARVVRTDLKLAVPITDLSVEGRGTELLFQWKTKEPVPSKVAYGADSSLGAEVGDSVPKTRHEVTVEGLSPDSRLAFAVSFPDSLDGSAQLTPVDYVNTGAVPGRHQFLRLKAVGLIYMDTNTGPGFKPLSDLQLAQAYEHYEELSRFYWINSGFKLWLDYTIVEIDRDMEECLSVWPVMQLDLEAKGFSALDDFDVVHATAYYYCGNWGGGGTLFDRSVGVCQWGLDQKFPAIHEANHSLDSIYSMNSFPKYEFNHGIWAVPEAIGRDFSVNGQIVRNMLSGNLTATENPFHKALTAPDFDNDGFPDTSPAGLDNPLIITEDSVGSSKSNSDTDGDGVSDRDEAMALVYHGINPLVRDTDEDGSNDTLDLNPAYPVSNIVEKTSPVIDGSIDPDEGWTVFTSQWGYSNDALIFDSNAYQDEIETYLSWDDAYFYIALKGPASETQVYLDGGNDGWFLGSDSYHLRVRNDSDSLQVRINVGVPDLFRQIDNDGQYSEFFDTDNQFTNPYRGQTIYNHPEDGPGFSDRLVTESDLLYAYGGAGNNSVWEMAVPWSNVTGFQGYVAKQMALEFTVGDDRIFEVDHPASVTLTGEASSITIVNSANRVSSTDFNFTGDLGSFSLDYDADMELPSQIIFSNLPPGIYEVKESLPPYWIIEKISCSDGSFIFLESATVSIELDSGEDVSCTFTNQFPEEVPIFSDGFE